MDESTKKALEGIRKNGGIEVMKASAGSGKTFSLAREYIRVLLSDNRKYPDERNSHRHILAVTFTNKATEEMKARIVKELNQLADEPRGSAYCSYLIGQCGFSGEEELQKASRVALNELLNDYGSFSVSTIDKFFQRTLRAFSREIGQGAEYRVELDRSSLVDEAADRFWDSLSESGDNRDGNALSSKALLDWVVDCTIDKINNGEGMKIEEAVKEFANGYLSASYEKKMRELGIDESKAFSEENIKRLRDICRQRIKEYWTGLNKAAKKLKKDAVYFFADDFLTVGALVALSYRGLRAPKDLKVVTWANRELGPVYPRDLTRMEMDELGAGRQAAAVILAYLKTGTFPTGVAVQPQWCPGETF